MSPKYINGSRGSLPNSQEKTDLENPLLTPPLASPEC